MEFVDKRGNTIQKWNNGKKEKKPEEEFQNK